MGVAPPLLPSVARHTPPYSCPLRYQVAWAICPARLIFLLDISNIIYYGGYKAHIYHHNMTPPPKTRKPQSSPDELWLRF